MDKGILELWLYWTCEIRAGRERSAPNIFREQYRRLKLDLAATPEDAVEAVRTGVPFTGTFALRPGEKPTFVPSQSGYEGMVSRDTPA